MRYNVEADFIGTRRRSQTAHELFNKRFETNRYRSDNDQFNIGDAMVLAGFIAEAEPHLTLEVGSGWSTAMMLDTIDAANLSTQLTCVEPFPERLLEAVPNFREKHELIDSRLQDAQLDDDFVSSVDLLLIDSSHVGKYRSDVLYELFELLPKLKSGTLVHIHDVFYPWEYPSEWLAEGRYWNEGYLLRALLMNSSRYAIESWPSALRNLDAKRWDDELSSVLHLGGGSIWIRVL